MKKKIITSMNPILATEVPMYISGTIRKVSASKSETLWWQESRARAGFIFTDAKPLILKDMLLFPYCPTNTLDFVRLGYFWIPK